MDKNDFDIDFEKEYGFDPKDFLSSDEGDFDYSEFDLSDLDDDLLSADEVVPQEDNDSVFYTESQEQFTFDVGEDQPAAENGAAVSGAEEEDLTADVPVREVPAEGTDVPAEQPEAVEPEEAPEEDAEEEDVPVRKRRSGNKFTFKMPKLPELKKKEKHVREYEQPEEVPEPIGEEEPMPKPRSAAAKLIDIYMEPVTKLKNEEVLDPLDPKYVRRMKREKKRIFKEVYLPVILVGVSLFLIISFIVGSISNALTVRKNKESTAKQEAQQQASQAGIDENAFKRLIAEAETMAISYDYDGAIELLGTYKGTNEKFKQQIETKVAELSHEKQNLKEVKDTSTIPNLSFHVLMVDPSRACNKDISGADLAGLYNKNFVTVEEFSRILNQLYSSNYVLVDFNSFVSTRTGVDGNSSFFADKLMLPDGKKPIMLTETMVNYFEYMVDPDKDGTPDAKGHGFANKLVVDGNGDIKAAYVDASGQSMTGNYDLVPVLESFIQEHPDFSYRGARAILAVSGTEGVFGYRTNTSYVSTRGQAYYDNEVAEARKLVAALREKGYTIASYTYSNQNYRSMTTLQIQAEIQNWTNQITPVLGDVDTIVFARGGDIEAYSGTTFNVLYNSGLRFFLNSGSSPRVDINTTFVRQTRLMVTGEAMAWYSSQFSDYFDCNVVMDLNGRGSTPTKS